MDAETPGSNNDDAQSGHYSHNDLLNGIAIDQSQSVIARHEVTSKIIRTVIEFGGLAAGLVRRKLSNGVGRATRFLEVYKQRDE